MPDCWVITICQAPDLKATDEAEVLSSGASALARPEGSSFQGTPFSLVRENRILMAVRKKTSRNIKTAR